MSYILDALKRADAERARATAVQPALAASPDRGIAPPRAARWRTPLLLATALGLAGGALAYWLTARTDRLPHKAPPSQTARPQEPAPANIRPQSVLPMDRSPVLRPATEPIAESAAPILAPASPDPAPVATSERHSSATKTSTPPANTAPPSAPAVQISGATHSDNPAHRMLIVNGKVVHEGQEIEPGLTVEVISPRSAVLNHRGSRYNINY